MRIRLIQNILKTVMFVMLQRKATKMQPHPMPVKPTHSSRITHSQANPPIHWTHCNCYHLLQTNKQHTIVNLTLVCWSLFCATKFSLYNGINARFTSLYNVSNLRGYQNLGTHWESGHLVIHWDVVLCFFSFMISLTSGGSCICLAYALQHPQDFASTFLGLSPT